MPEIVCKILNEDGTEASYGPMPVTRSDANKIIELLVPHAEKAEKAAATDRITDIEQESAARSAAAEKANAEYARLGQHGKGKS